MGVTYILTILTILTKPATAQLLRGSGVLTSAEPS
jgi:hypothetical protein